MHDPHADARQRALRDAAVAGDPAAWAALFDPAAGPVASYIRWRTAGLPDLADDAAQETWLLAARALARFDPARGPFAGWVCGLAGGVIRNLIRGRRRYAARVRPLTADPPAAASDAPERVAAALAELPDRYEQALRMKYLDGLTVDQMAGITGESVKAVESVLGRARQAFREAYERGADG